MKWVLLIVLLSIFLGGILVLFTMFLFSLADSKVDLEKMIGKPAPNFVLRDVFSGQNISLKDFRGKIVLLDFWATWCAPCRKALSHLASIYKKYGDKDVIIISIDLGEKIEVVKNFAIENNITWIIVIDNDGSIAEKYNVKGIPTLFLIDRKGIIRYIHVGFSQNLQETLGKEIEKIFNN